MFYLRNLITLNTLLFDFVIILINICFTNVILIIFRNEVFIGLQFCWDGADMFEFSGKVIWPLAVSILNFPKDLRDKMNIGLHVIAMCTGDIVF